MTQEFILGKSTLTEKKQTQLWHVRGPEDPRIREAGRILREGGLVAFPTETVYGLGANGLDGPACARIYAAKGRPADNPLILHVDSLEMARSLVGQWPEKARQLANKFWPGPLTMILPAASCVPRQVTAGLDTVALRFPSARVAQALIEAAGVPIAAPSANLSGRPSPTAASHVLEDLGGRIDVILDGGACPVGLESTIIDLSVEPPAVLRPGDITAEELTQLLGPLAQTAGPGQAGTDASAETAVPEAADRAGSSPQAAEAVQGPKAPGMKYRHYAPKAPVTILQGQPAAVARYVWQQLTEARAAAAEQAATAAAATSPAGAPPVVAAGAPPALAAVNAAAAAATPPANIAAAARQRTALLLSEETWKLLASRGLEEPEVGAWFCRSMGSRRRPREMAGRLYDVLRACDTAGVTGIFAEGISTADQGAAVMNRLKKAAGNRVLKLN